jgi:hypothetical protein
MIDAPIRKMCDDLRVAYSTWLDDLAFSGENARHLIQPAIRVLADNGLRVKRSKIRIMGPTAIKILTGTRLGSHKVRSPKEKLSRVRSGIHKLQQGLVEPSDEETFISGLVGQLRFIEQLCPSDVRAYASTLKNASKRRSINPSSRNFLDAIRGQRVSTTGGRI